MHVPVMMPMMPMMPIFITLFLAGVRVCVFLFMRTWRVVSIMTSRMGMIVHVFGHGAPSVIHRQTFLYGIGM